MFCIETGNVISISCVICQCRTRDFLGISLVAYLVTPEAPPWSTLRGEQNLKLCPSRMLENAFPKMLSIIFCDGKRQRKTKCSKTIPWRALYFLPNRCLEISLYMFVYSNIRKTFAAYLYNLLC